MDRVTSSRRRRRRGRGATSRAPNQGAAPAQRGWRHRPRRCVRWLQPLLQARDPLWPFSTATLPLLLGHGDPAPFVVLGEWPAPALMSRPPAGDRKSRPPWPARIPTAAHRVGHRRRGTGANRGRLDAPPCWQVIRVWWSIAIASRRPRRSPPGERRLRSRQPVADRSRASRTTRFPSTPTRVHRRDACGFQARGTVP